MAQAPSRSHWKRNAAFFIGGQFLSSFGSMLVSYAITWHITLEAQSGVLIALFTCAGMLPMVFISPFAGVWADRYNRKHLVNLADGAIALMTLLMAILFTAGVRNTWLLMVIVVARSIGQGIQNPAASALIPQIVPEEHLTRFNGIQGTAHSLTVFAAPMAAGALLTFLPLEHIFFIDVITAAIGIATVFFFVKVKHTPRKAPAAAGAKAYYTEMMAGFRYIGSQPWLRTLIIFMAFFCVFVSPAAILTPLQVARSFGDDVWRLTAVEVAFSVGMMLGGVFIAAWGGFKNKVHTMVFSQIAFGVTTVLFGVVPNFWIYLAVMGLCGCSMPLFNTPSYTLLQTRVPPNMMGRVFSTMGMINGLGMPLGIAFFGPLSDVMPIEPILVVTGALIVLSGLVMLGRRELVSAGVAPAPSTDDSPPAV